MYCKDLTAMVLEMYLNNKLVDSLPLSTHKIIDAIERELYIQGAIHHLTERWHDLLVDQDLEPTFYIKPAFFNGRNDFLFS